MCHYGMILMKYEGISYAHSVLREERTGSKKFGMIKVNISFFELKFFIRFSTESSSFSKSKLIGLRNLLTDEK